MARIRTIKPAFFTSEDSGTWSDSTKVIFMGLIVMASDNGIGSANPMYLAGQILPYQDQREALMRIHEAFSEAQVPGSVVLFRRDDRDFYWLRGWAKHQYVQHPSKDLPDLPTEAEIQAYKDHHGALTSEDDAPTLVLMKPQEASCVSHEASGLERKGREGKGKETPPAGAGGVQGGSVALAVQPPLMAEIAPPPASPATRGSRLDPDWTPSATTIAWTHREAETGLDITVEWAKFQDYWLARAGAGARKVDWDRTWKNWVRKAVDDSRRRSGRTSTGRTTKDQRVLDILAMGQRISTGNRPASEQRAIDW